MDINNEAFADKIAALCFDKYASLSKNGKPVKNKEWTLLAGFVVESDNQFEVVSLATGTKCIGRSFMTADGTVLNDSHAEVLARRCLLRYFYHQLQKIMKGETSKLFKQHETEKYKFESHKLKLHMFTSHVPCGDASILPKEDDPTSPSSTLKDKLCEVGSEDNNKSEDHAIKIQDSYKRDQEKCSNCISVSSVDNENKDALKIDGYSSTKQNCTELVREVNNKNVTVENFQRCKEDISNDRTNDGINKISNISPNKNSLCTLQSYFGNNQDLPFSTDSTHDCPAKKRRIGNENNIFNEGRTSETCDNNSQQISNCLQKYGFCKDSDYVGNIVPDIYRTGAKCLPNSELQDAKDPGIGYHVVGVVRTKPGRGDPTSSVSCSDKIARWVALGVQGALLSTLLDRPIHMSSITVGGGGPYSGQSMLRALVLRSGTTQTPLLLRSNLVFESSRYIMNEDCKPCPSSIMWADVPER